LTQPNTASRRAGSAACQYLTFITAGEEYGIDILRVQEIRGWDKATAIPNTPDYVKGVINLRGTIVPIIDLRARFGLARVEYAKTTVVIVLRVDQPTREWIVGIVVDAVSDVYGVQESDVCAPPELSSTSAHFVKGIVAIEDKMVLLLDIDRLLSREELDIASE
jgi:purine-binding chemotaxis protein CheW